MMLPTDLETRSPVNGAAFRHRHSVDYSLGGGNQIFITILRVVDKIKLKKN